jgi:hypothetical protein
MTSVQKQTWRKALDIFDIYYFIFLLFFQLYVFHLVYLTQFLDISGSLLTDIEWSFNLKKYTIELDRIFQKQWSRKKIQNNYILKYNNLEFF